MSDDACQLRVHFVDQCRAAGRTWAEIREALGVTKQAAHKRYSMAPRDLSRFTTRARGAIEAAVDAARGLGHGYVGTEHLLLALFRDPEGLASKILSEADLCQAAAKEWVVTKLVAISQRS